MRERVSFLMVIFVQFCPSTQNPCLGLCFRTLRVRVGVFQLGWNFTSPTLTRIQHGMRIRALASGEGITPTSYHLEVLRYSQPSEPQMWGFLRFALRIAAAAAAASGACLPALPTALSPPTSSCQIVDAICIYPFSLLRRICWGSHFFQRSGLGSNLEHWLQSR